MQFHWKQQIFSIKVTVKEVEVNDETSTPCNPNEIEEENGRTNAPMNN